MRAELLGFGVGSEGQLGIRTTGDNHFIHSPEHIIGAPCGHSGASIVDVACGEKHTIFLAEDGKLWSVGGNELGQLGRGNTSIGSFTIYPIAVSISAKFIQIASGRNHVCAVTEDGRLFAWGDNVKGQCALPHSILQQPTPKRIPLNEVIQVACGSEHSVVLLENGRVFVWGQQFDGACWHDPTEVAELLGIPVISVHAGGAHWMALSSSGAVLVWGKNDYGQLGLGDNKFRPHPTPQEGLAAMKVVDIALGDSHSLFLTHDGRVFACGSDTFGQLGRGKKKDEYTPQVVMDLMGSHVTRIAAGRLHSMAVVGGHVFSFGLNSSGQLGQGSTRNHINPRMIDELDCVRSIFCGWDQSFVVRAGGVSGVRSGPNVELKYPQVLSWTSQREILKDKLDLLTQIESAFTSLSCLNGSFLFNDDRRYNCSLSQSCVNLDDAMEFFNAVASSSDNPQYNELILDSLEMSLFADDTDPKAFLDLECIRAMLYLPWVDAFLHTNAKYIRRFHVAYCNLYHRLTKQQNKALVSWWARIPVRHFKRVVSGLVAAIKTSINDNLHDPSMWKPVLNVLRDLSFINLSSARIPLENFYVDDLSQKIDLKMDYFRRATKQPGSFFWSDYPFILNGVAKGELLLVEGQLAQMEASHTTNQIIGLFGVNLLLGDPYFTMNIRREHVMQAGLPPLFPPPSIQDTLNHVLREDPNKMRKPLKINFEGEEADDLGGVKKEYFVMLFEKLLLPEYGMFFENEESHLIWFSGVEQEDNDNFRMVGILCGLAVYNNVLVPFPFPLALYKLILEQPLTLEDLAELSPTEGKSLQSLLDYEGDDVKEVFMLNFTISFSMFGQSIEEPLVEGGSEKAVTSSNRSEYVSKYVQARMVRGLNNEVRRQIESFREGFRLIVNSRIMKLFQPRELMELVVGNENFDWSKFKERMQYKGVYHARHPSVLAFWNAFFELSLDERKDFLQFLTGCTRLPVRGMDGLDACIQPCASHLLPVAHTCFNLLDLPDLPDKDEQLRRLRISIAHPRGFSLV